MKKCKACGRELAADQYTRAEADECKECEAKKATDPMAVISRLADGVNGLVEQQKALAADTERRINQTLAKLAGGELTTPSKTTEEPKITVSDRFVDGHGKPWTRSDFELAMMVFQGSHRIQMPVNLYPPEDLTRAWVANVFEDKASPAPWVADANGRPIRQLTPQPVLEAIKNKRAMDSAETGYGLELIGAQYVRDLWQAARNMDSIVSDIRTIPQTDPTTYVPIDGNVPEMLFVGESTSASAAAYTTTKTPSSRVTLTAKKFTIQQVWSAELNEDSIIAFTPFLREMLSQSAAVHLGSAFYNGDTTDAGTGNINLDDANPADTKHYLAWDGIRHYVLVDATGQGKSMAAALDLKEINVARGKLNGGDDDVDNAVTNINWGMVARNLRIVADWDTYMALLDSDKVVTVDKYGAAATILTGELGSLYGIPIISPPYASKTEADGKCSTAEASNTKGQIMIYAPAGWISGVRRDVQLFFDRIQRTDQFLFELYTRRSFTRFGGNVAAGIYNISL